MIRRAERKKSKLRLALTGPSGSGKTYSALQIAKGLGGKICVIDTEYRSSDLYSHLVEYSVIDIVAPFDPSKYIAAIDEIEKAGYDTIIIDSISHCWDGEGGLLDQQAKIPGNSYTAWRQITPKQNRLIEAILQSKCHVIATMRSKQDYVLETDSSGKQVPKKVGMAPVQRDGIDYEFTTVFDIDLKHVAHTSKDRTDQFNDFHEKLSESVGERFLDWLESGAEVSAEQEPAPEKKQPKNYVLRETSPPDQKSVDHGMMLNSLINLAEKSKIDQKTILSTYKVSSLDELTVDQIQDFSKRVSGFLDKKATDK